MAARQLTYVALAITLVSCGACSGSNGQADRISEIREQIPDLADGTDAEVVKLAEEFCAFTSGEAFTVRVDELATRAAVIEIWCPPKYDLSESG